MPKRKILLYFKHSLVTVHVTLLIFEYEKFIFQLKDPEHMNYISHLYICSSIGCCYNRMAHQQIQSEDQFFLSHFSHLGCCYNQMAH